MSRGHGEAADVRKTYGKLARSEQILQNLEERHAAIPAYDSGMMPAEPRELPSMSAVRSAIEEVKQARNGYLAWTLYTQLQQV